MIKFPFHILIISLITTGLISGQKVTVPTTGPENGHLIIAGGGLRDISVFNLFIRLAGEPDAHMVVIPTSDDDNFYLKCP